MTPQKKKETPNNKQTITAIRNPNEKKTPHDTIPNKDKNKTKSTKKINWNKVDAISEDTYNYDDAPELTEEFLKIAFIRKPLHKKPVSIRLDEDIIEFFKKINRQYQTKINDVLRAYKIAYEKTHH